MAKFVVWAEMNFHGARAEEEFEIDDKFLVGLTSDEREKYIERESLEYLCNLVNWGFDEIE